MNGEKYLTCLACPKGCRVRVSFDGDGNVTAVSGSRCGRGREWAEQELSSPMRTLTTTVRTSFTDFPRLPVRSERDVPLSEIPRMMKKIEFLIVEERLFPGIVVEKEVYRDDEGAVALIATGDMR